MKISKFILGLMAGLSLILFLGASSSQTSNEESARYHMILISGATQAYVYDSVTGEYRNISYNQVKKGNNIKTLLVE